jgi:ribosomal protein L36
MGCAVVRACYRPSATLCRRPSSARAADFPPRCAADRQLHVPQTAGTGNRCLDRWICRPGCAINRACCRPSATLRLPGKAGKSLAARAEDCLPHVLLTAGAGSAQTAVPRRPLLGLCAPKTASRDCRVVHRKLVHLFTCAAHPRHGTRACSA